MAERNEDPGGVLVQVCLSCGKEYMYDNQEPPENLQCEKCGSTVFRSFFADTREDDVAEDFRESTERDVSTTDPATEVTRGDLHDLSNL